jgi:hypothetical protein
MPLAKGDRGAMSRRAEEHGGVADLLWDDVKCFFDLDSMGSLPDVRVPNTSVEDWQAVLDLISGPSMPSGPVTPPPDNQQQGGKSCRTRRPEALLRSHGKGSEGQVVRGPC